MDDLTERIVAYTRAELAPPELAEQIDETSPLLEMGVLDSLKTAMLLNFIREQLGVRVPPMRMEFANFKDIASIAAMVRQLLAAAG
ncbi:MAG: acyl carrier protein [Actinobacteria bacterium]|nr:acyl carrier protein [Actinomycetota bacterium]